MSGSRAAGREAQDTDLPIVPVPGDPVAGLIEIDRESRISYADPAAAGFLCVSVEALEGKRLQDALPCAAYPELIEKTGLSLEKHTPADFDIPSLEKKDLRLHCRIIPSPRGLILTLDDLSGRRREEESLKASEAKHRTIFDSANDAIFVHDPETGAILAVNRKMTEMYGYTEDEACAMTVEDISSGVPPYNQEGAAQRIRSAMEHGGDIFEWQARDKSGRIFWVEVTLKTAEVGGRLNVIGIIRDITDRKASENTLEMAKAELEQRVETRTRELAEQKELLQTIIDRIPVMVTFWSPEGRLRLVNKEFERLTGWPIEEAGNMDILAAGFPDPAYRKRIMRTVAEAAPGWGEFALSTRSGNILEISWAAVRFSDGSIIGIGIDVTEHKRMELELMRLFAAVEQTGEGIALAGPEGTIEYVNPAYEKMSGYRRDELIGKNVSFFQEYFAGHDLEEIMDRHVREGKTWRSRQSRKKKTGELIDVDVIASPVWDRTGKIINYISVVRDVTQEVRLQKQLFQTQKMEAIGALAGGIAHDLKNVLTPILLNTETAIEELGSGHPARPVLEEALDAARLGRDLVQEILTFSRRDPGKKSLVNVPAVIRETLSFLRSTLPSTIDIRSEIKDERIMACADPTQIKQVLINLGSNAGYAMRERGGTLEVTESSLDLSREEAGKIAPDLAPGPYIQVTVQDTGYGMDERIMEHIFEPFFTTKKGDGTGMGLAVAHGIVEGHQGAITVRSKPGRGTAFSVYLPSVDDGCTGESTETQRG